MENELKTTQAYTSLEINVNCPYCDNYFDIRDEAIENLCNGELSIENIEQEITCPDCKEDFIVTDIFY